MLGEHVVHRRVGDGEDDEVGALDGLAVGGRRPCAGLLCGRRAADSPFSS